MRYIKTLLEQARSQTVNDDFGEDDGIPQDVLLEYANEAQDHIQAVIINNFPSEFLAEKTINVQSGVEAYEIDDNVFANNRIKSVQYSCDGQAREFYNLDQRTIRDRVTDTDSHPSFYIRRGSTIYLNPIPTQSTAKIRVEYFRELDDLDLRRGKVDSQVNDGTNYQSITLVSGTEDSTALGDLQAGDYVSVVDVSGNLIKSKLLVDFYTSASRTITLTGSNAFDSSIQNGHYLVIGKYATTHGGLPKNVERYIVNYVAMKILQQDSSEDYQEQIRTLGAIEADIVDSFGDASEDVQFFPILDSEFI